MQLSRVPIEDLGPVIDRLWDIIPQCTGGAATLLEQIASQEKCIHSFVARWAKKEKVPLQSNGDDGGYDAASSTVGDASLRSGHRVHHTVSGALLDHSHTRPTASMSAPRPSTHA